MEYLPSLMQQYQKLLKTQKEIIKTNVYMQELEKSYSKPRHRTNLHLSRNPLKSKSKPHHWPIESCIFTKILQKKLKNELSPSSKDYFKSRSRISMKQKKHLQNYSRLRLKPLDSNQSFQTDLERSLDSIISLRSKEKVKTIGQSFTQSIS
jgi:hypothetical protein